MQFLPLPAKDGVEEATSRLFLRLLGGDGTGGGRHVDPEDALQEASLCHHLLVHLKWCGE